MLIYRRANKKMGKNKSQVTELWVIPLQCLKTLLNDMIYIQINIF